MLRHRGAGRTEQHLGPQVEPVEEDDQLLVVAAVRRVGEDEPLELRLALPPGVRAPAEQPVQVVEVGVDDRVTDLVEALRDGGRAGTRCAIL